MSETAYAVPCVAGSVPVYRKWERCTDVLPRMKLVCTMGLFEVIDVRDGVAYLSWFLGYGAKNPITVEDVREHFRYAENYEVVSFRYGECAE